MQRRTFVTTLTGAGAALSTASNLFGQERKAGPPSHYEPNWQSIKRHPLPKWFDDAKFGIFIHWGLYSVPAWAPPTGELGKVDWNKWFYENPYAEWYLNTLRLKTTPTAKYHAGKYGANFDYYDFAKTFNTEIKKWQPEKWASLFKDSGAKYAVLTSKHHDGFTLWPSAVAHPKANGRTLNASRDLVGELTTAVRAAGLKMGLYYSGGLDWSFETTPIATMAQVGGTVIQTEEFGAYALAHWRELIDKYQPALLWNDIGYPRTGKVETLFAEYLNKVKDGAINNRFSQEWADFTTPEYAQYDRITQQKWESCRGLGFSFGYNQVEGPEHVLAPDKLIAMLVDIVAKNGNLLLNIGPKPDGSISEIQMDRLTKLGAWLKVNGEGLFESRPWVNPSAKTADGTEVRFTKKPDAVYAFLLSRPKAGTQTITIPNVLASDGMKVRILGVEKEMTYKQVGRDIVVNTPAQIPGDHTLTVKLSPAPWQAVQG